MQLLALDGQPLHWMAQQALSRKTLGADIY
jgi:hypothetical protein